MRFELLEFFYQAHVSVTPTGKMACHFIDEALLVQLKPGQPGGGMTRIFPHRPDLPAFACLDVLSHNSPLCQYVEPERTHQSLSYWVIMAPHYDQRDCHPLQEFRNFIRARRPGSGRSIALYLILGAVAASCERDVAQPPAQGSACIEGGVLTAEVFGAIETSIDWREGDLECEGMPRPHGRGARLRFAGTGTSNGETIDLAFIIALPDLEKGRGGRELPAGVTLIEENSGKFFSTPEPSTCWADIEHQAPLGDQHAIADAEYRIKGLLYCVSPLAEVNGNRSVAFTDLSFAGRLNWRVPK
jgi:hypothetical protein